MKENGYNRKWLMAEEVEEISVWEANLEANISLSEAKYMSQPLK